MSVQQLNEFRGTRAPRGDGVAGPGAATGRVAAAVEQISRVAAEPLAAVGTDQLPTMISDLAVLESMVAALKVDALAEADQRRIAEAQAATGTDAWAAALTGSTRGVMAGGIWLARQLRETYHHTRAAFATGGINQAQARVIVNACVDLPRQVTDDQRTEAEAGLVAKAVAGTNARNLRRAAKRMLEKIRDDLVDQDEADRTRRDERHAERETWFGLWDNGNGTYSGKFTIPELHGRMLAGYLERLTSPRRLSRNNTGDLVADPTIDNGLDQLSWTESLGVGFCELIEHLPTQGHTGGNGAVLLVKVDHQRLLDGLSTAGLDTGATISVGETLRLACNSGVMPLVYGGASEPLHLGRTRRLHSEPQRRALAIKHDTCAAEGCERPFAWCEIHHPHPWAEGGRTDYTNALPLCFYHHRRAHDDQFTLRTLASGEVRYRRRR